MRSMTGYGRGAATAGERRFVVELRSVNHRFGDVRLRLPQALNPLERELRQVVQKRVRRGRVDGNVSVEACDATASSSFNHALFEQVQASAERLARDHGVIGTLDLATVLNIPGLFRGDPQDIEWDDDAIAAIRQALESAVEAFDADRAREGAALREVLEGRAGAMRVLCDRLTGRAQVLPSRLRDRLRERIAGLAEGVELDPQRIAQEAVLLAERADVTEELDRLRGHLEQLATLVGEPSDEPIGKRLEFLVQEIQRETNTINSKSGDLELSRIALDLKAEAEKVREQVLNLE